MSSLEGVSGPWLDWIVAASWQLALLIAIVALAMLAARAMSPRLRHALWLIVLVKVFLPPSLTAPWSIGRWAVAPLLETTERSGVSVRWAAGSPESDVSEETPSDVPRGIASRLDAHVTRSTTLLVVWSAGCALFWGAIAWRYARLTRALRRATPIDEGPLRVALERIALALGVRCVPELFSTTIAGGPFLIGVARPRIILPSGSLEKLGPLELESVLAHELAHWKHRDTWIGWWQVLAQGLFWFHPLLWWANAQLRHERECVCDEAVLRLGHVEPQGYSEAILRVLTAVRARSLVTGSLVGVFERGAKLQNRLENIMNYQGKRRRFGWATRAAAVLFAVVFLPMAAGSADSKDSSGGQTAAPAKKSTPYPQIVKTTPERGAVDVDPALAEIAVTFDRDMQKGMSWTGGPPLFPPTDETRDARWTDARTCVLPVKLEQGSYYRLGINSTSYQNFKASDGVAAPPSAIYFVTKGATPQVRSRVRVPKIVSLKPKQGASDVDPKTTTLRVTFDVPMGEGMSWTGGGEAFPKTPDDKQAVWSPDGLTCSLPVQLEPGHDYRLGFNSLSYNNFASKWGVSLVPVVYTFRTAAGK